MMLKPIHTLLAVALLFMVAIYVRAQAELVSDAAWFLYVADGLLHGKKLYVDFMEVNPPLGMWLTVPIQWIAQTLHIPAIATMKGVYFALTVLTLALSYRYLNSARCFIIALAAALLFMPVRDFAEREHLAVLWFLPWLFLRTTQRDVSTFEKIMIGLMAGAAICIKPQSIAAPVLVEAVLLWHSRQIVKSFAIENIAIVAFSAAYAAAILVFTPQFLNEMLHLGVTAYLPYNGEGLLGILYMGRWAVILLVLGLVIRRAVRTAGLNTLVMDVLLAATIGFTVSYFLQAKGFFYQSMPANILGMAACAAGSIQLLQGSASRIFAVISAIIGIGFLYNEGQSYVDMDYAFQPALEAQAPQAKSIFIATSRIDLGFPFVVKHNLTWASRMPTQWLVPYVVAHASATDDPIVAKARDITVTDIAMLKPQVIFIDSAVNQESEPGGAFDYLKFWNDDPRFSALWQNYEKRQTLHGFDVYVLKP